MEQKAEFLSGEGDAFFRRNRQALTQGEQMAQADPLLALLAGWPALPGRVLEIGCANGWRLHRLREIGATHLHGIDPGATAIAEGRAAYPDLNLNVGTADKLTYPDGSFDLVIFGFCLSWCDPADHFRIVAEADRVLCDQGQLCVLDFDPPFPYRNPYTHRAGLSSYKLDYSRLFLAHPHYHLREKRMTAHGGSTSNNPDDRIAVTWLTKDLQRAWPSNPWK